MWSLEECLIIAWNTGEKFRLWGFLLDQLKEYHRVVGGGYRHLGKFPWGAVAPKDLKNPDLLS